MNVKKEWKYENASAFVSPTNIILPISHGAMGRNYGQHYGLWAIWAMNTMSTMGTMGYGQELCAEL